MVGILIHEGSKAGPVPGRSGLYSIDPLLFRLISSRKALAYLSVVPIPDFLKLTCSALLRMARCLHCCVCTGRRRFIHLTRYISPATASSTEFQDIVLPVSGSSIARCLRGQDARALLICDSRPVNVHGHFSVSLTCPRNFECNSSVTTITSE